MILLKFSGESIQLTNSISGGFQTQKSCVVLRCAQCSKFRLHHVHHSRAVIQWWYWRVSTFQDSERFSFLFNMACRDGFGKLAWKGIFFSGTGAMWAKIWADFFGWKISHFWAVLKI